MGREITIGRYMHEVDLIESLGKGAGLGSIAVAALVMLSRIVKTIGERMIGAIDKLTDRLDEHSKSDIGAISLLTERMARMEGKIDTALELTPVEGIRRARTDQPMAAAAGYYSPRKPPREDG